MVIFLFINLLNFINSDDFQFVKGKYKNSQIRKEKKNFDIIKSRDDPFLVVLARDVPQIRVEEPQGRRKKRKLV